MKRFHSLRMRCSALSTQYGADSVGVLGSARATNEENYLAQKFARVVLGTNNVDCCARVCHAPTATAMKLMLGAGAATNSFDDIESASTILVCGANPTENHPIVGARIKAGRPAGNAFDCALTRARSNWRVMRRCTCSFDRERMSPC